MKKFLYRFFIYRPQNSYLHAQITMARAGVFLGIMFVWLYVDSAMDLAPPLSTASTIEGRLSFVDAGTRNRHVIQVENESLAVRGGVNGPDSLGAELESQIGKVAKIWYYKQWDLFFLETEIIEISIDEEYLIGNWEQVRSRIKHPAKIGFLLVGLLMFALFGNQVPRVLQKESEVK